MESKKFNWNRLLSCLIAGVGFVLLCLFIGICFVTPIASVSVKALTKQDIEDANIYFVSAKTKIKKATNYERVQKVDKDGNYFYTYEYNYTQDANTTPLYYTTEKNKILKSYDSLSNVYLTSNGKEMSLFEEYQQNSTDDDVSTSDVFIPSGITSFKNSITNSIEDVFYDKIDDGDFVLLNNYSEHSNYPNTPFNVENFYLSFGTSYGNERENAHTTPLYDLKVQGKLYSKNQTHMLKLNSTTTHQLSTGQKSYYWYQYFDLNNLQAFKTNEGAETYDIQDQQGKYVFTFEFMRYNHNDNGSWSVLDSLPQKFTYTFYLLNSDNYDAIPTINNATLGAMENDKINEYFYNFTNDTPYLRYDPESFNISYTRENKEISEAITSAYSLGTYTLNGHIYPKGIITFYSNGSVKKQIYILVNYNTEKTRVEYLYLSTNSQNTLPISEYEDALNLINNDTLKFEYKVTQTLTKTNEDPKTTSYTTNTYYTYDYNKLEFCTDEHPDNYDISNSTSESISEKNFIADLNTTNLAEGIILNKENLATASTLDENSIKYVLYTSGDISTLTKYYKNSSGEDASMSTTLTTITDGTYSFFDTIDTHLEVIYKVEGENVTSVQIVRHTYETSNTMSYTRLLDKLNNLSSLDVDIKYNLKFEDLGIYTFDYKYNCIVCDEDSIKQSIINDNENSTNILKLNDFAQTFSKLETSSNIPDTDITLNIWGHLDPDNKVTLNGTEYTYYPSTTKLTITLNDVSKELTLSENNKLTSYLGNVQLDATYSINTDINGNSYLQISYEIANLKTTISETSYTSQKLVNGSYIDYVTNHEAKTQESIKLIDKLNDGIGSDETHWGNIIRLLKYLKDNSTTTINTLNYYSTSPQISKDILHIYGSTAYFNKTNSETDSGYAKFSQVDSKLNTNYASDITKYVKSSNGFYANSLINANDIKNITDGDANGIVNVAIKNGLKIDDIIVTDVTPVFWKNLSTLLYNGKVSQSYIYRYPNYKITDDTNNPISYGTCQTSLYTKDTYCQQDGLYEIVVLYKYDSFKSLDEDYTYDNTIFYQVFTFIIDNSSPKINIKVQDVNDVNNNGNSTEYITDLGLNKYTNKNIQISWNIPTYFQNDVYIDIQRIAFDNTSSNNFKATYQKGTITTNSGNSTFANNVTEFKQPQLTDTEYCVYITGDQSNGNYKVTLHYSSRGASTITQEFIIDKQKIDGMKVLPVQYNTGNGSYSLYTAHQSYVESNQIINYDFTFRYNPKASNAKIYTYWYRIDLVASSNYDQELIVNSNETAITTTFNVNGKDSDSYSYGNQYIYNYGTDDDVLSSNYFTSNSSCIYLFKMVDEAGNECRYVVFYDTTTPRFKLDPTPNNAHNIVNDTTKLVFGDYKAIKIDTLDDFTIDLNSTLDNYTKSDINDKLKESLIYLNSSNNFNDTKIQEINGDYYMLLPIEEINITDISTTTLNTPDSTKNVRYDGDILDNLDKYYFFPTDPIINAEDGKKYINTGSYESEVRTSIESFTYKQAKDSYLKPFNRFVETTNENVYGTIGKGEFSFQIYDKQRNKVEGYVWMSLDRTQTFAYGIFDTKTPDDPSKATAITGEEGTYALSKLYLSSLQANESEKIPDYTLTYRFYELNDKLYENLQNNYKIKSAKISENPENNKQTYLQLVYESQIDGSELAYKIELTNEDGELSAMHSYPYDIQGVAGEPDSSGNPQHVYKTNKSSYKVDEDEDRIRIFTKMINPTPDATGKSDTVTQEGLYIFKRMYTDTNITDEELGLDERIVYFVYYIDRTGIINVTTLNDISKNLLSYKQDLGFVLGSDYSDQNLKKFINADSIENSQVLKNASSTSSNTYYNVSNLFTTNKILVEFNLTADKYNFSAFKNKFYQNIVGQIDPSLSEETKNNIKAYLFNEDYYSYSLYKINLTLTKGQAPIIDESETDPTKIYNTTLINNLLKGYDLSSSVRSNSFSLFLQDNNSNEYNVYLKDNSGYRVIENGAMTDSNRNPNELDISFYIKHNAPTGDSYGKYYGRHDYDEDNTTNHSIPIEEYIGADGKVEERYALLSKYLQGGQLEPLSLSNKKVTMDTENGQQVELFSTNNESLIFTFEITKDDTKAQIDPNNIQIYKGSVSEDNLIFNRVDGINIDTALVPASRMSTSYFCNTINGIDTYAIVVFDNNLDEILNKDETEYSYFRLLNSENNPDQETYYIKLNYVGKKSNYIKEDNKGNKISYFSTTYKVRIDRNKPTYNLTKLMDLDKYIYNTVTTTPTQTNYETVFQAYKPFYNFQADKQYDFERSDLEKYFFALDYRQSSSFVFESISELDSYNGIYIRPVDKTNYKFSKTPDDYKSYYEATYMPGNPQFSPNRATSLNKNFGQITDTTQYYFVPYGLFSDDPNDKTIKAYDLMAFLKAGQYYEIIEKDEAGNYRVYAVYLPEFEQTKITFKYKINNKTDDTDGSIGYNSNTIINISGVDFRIIEYKTTDYFAKANITISSSNLNETLSVVYNPSERCIYVRTSTNTIRDKFEDVALIDFQTKFIEVINNTIKNYNDIVSSKTSEYYTQFGYVIQLNIIDRLGIQSSISNKLFDYEFTYNVAGSIIEPKFKNNASNFNMIIPPQQGTTFITSVKAFKFQSGWDNPKDPDDLGNSFNKNDGEFKKGTTYTLNKGVYKFVITDNFQRTNTYFYEFGSSSTQAGGILNFSNKNILHTDGYTYTSSSANFVYDNSLYDIYIKFVGEVPSQDITYVDSDTTPHIVYSNNKSYSESDLSQYGIKVATIDNITTITFLGVTDLTKYHIKTIPASISSEYDYKWGKEYNDPESKFLVYDKKLAIYTGIQNVIVRNSNGNILDTSEHLTLSEDFEVTLAWTNGYDPEKQIDFGSKIYLERNYLNNPPEKLDSSNTYSITKPGDYTAYVYNNLNKRSEVISFTRGEGEIGIYSIFKVDNTTRTRLNPSTKVSSETYVTETEDRNLIEFNYFTTLDYFSFKNTATSEKVDIQAFLDNQNIIDNIADIQIDKTTGKYIDIQVKSDLSIFAQLHELSVENGAPFAKFRIYSKNNNNDEYTYRFVKIYYLKNVDYNLATTFVSNVYSSTVSQTNNIYNSSPTIKRPDNYLYVTFKFKDLASTINYVEGNTIYVDRYFNGELVETQSYTTITDDTESRYTLSQVGLHKFVVRDLAGRIQTFGTGSTKANALQIYLVNQILFEVNDSTPINNQIFNSDVNIKIKSELAGLTLYNTRTLGITVTLNGQEIGVANSGEYTFSEPGSYSIKMVATTVLSDDTTTVADQEISTTYKFMIVKTNIATKSFNVSKGTGFEIDKIIKIVNNEREEVTEKFKNLANTENSGSLLWLTHENQGNSKFEISLKYYNQTLKDYQKFTFNVWINNDQPVIISSIPDGTSSKDAITLSFNPGIIYSQVGNCKILVNDKEYLAIDENSDRTVETITIAQKGTYWIKIVSEDGTLISSYKYTKNDPISKTTKIVLISVACGVVVLVVLFLLIRRKGKYR